jgi:hypothetical protein
MWQGDECLRGQRVGEIAIPSSIRDSMPVAALVGRLEAAAFVLSGRIGGIRPPHAAFNNKPEQ